MEITANEAAVRIISTLEGKFWLEPVTRKEFGGWVQSLVSGLFPEMAGELESILVAHIDRLESMSFFSA